MRDLLVASCSLALALTISAGCDSEDSAPPPGVSVGGNTDAGPRDGSSHFVPIGGRRDTGMDDDGGSEGGDAGLNQNCEDVDFAPPGSVEPAPGTFYNQVAMPTDLPVTRVLIGWEASCTQPTIRIVMSDGDCPDGDGHELTFFIPADGIENHSIVLGQNALSPEPASGSIRVRYSRPDGDLEDPIGEWGTCAGVSGTVDFIDQLETTEDSLFEGSFQLELTRCDDGLESTQNVTGSFSVELPVGLEEVCP